MLANAQHDTHYAEPQTDRVTVDRTKDPLNAARGMMIATAVCTAFWGAVGVAIFA